MTSKSIQRILPLVALLFMGNYLYSQNKMTTLPDIPNFYTLKCDFHLHTVFSDGHVWPTLRVSEAIRDGLDAIALTDHIDYEGFPEVIAKDYNKPYEIAKQYAEGKGLIVIKGCEISPRVPPYHHNALFLKDVNKLPIEYMKETGKKFVMKDEITRKQLTAPFKEAKKQGAFVFYNHPGFNWWDKKDTAIFTSLHRELWENKIIQGVEVVNSGVYNIIAHKIAETYHLTLLGNSDTHGDVYYTYKDTHRPMTLVFAKEKSEEGIKEALFARRTAVYVDDYIIARQAEAEAFFKASLTVSSERKTREKGEKVLMVNIVNNSCIPYKMRLKSDYDIEKYPLGQVTLAPQDTTTVVLKELWKYPPEITLQVEVYNVITSPEKNLQTTIVLDLTK